MRVLIIGGTGVLSSAVSKACLNKGYQITMINRGNRLIPNGVEHIKADKDNHDYIRNCLKGRHFDAVMDFLCYTDQETSNSVGFYSDFTDQYFYISSCAVYDIESLNGKEAKEDSPKGFQKWKYSTDKWASEQKLISLLKDSDVKYTIIRPSITYDDSRIPYGILPPYGYHWTLCSRILAGKPIIRWNCGKNKSNMMRVEDFAIGVVELVGNNKAYNETFNICGEDTPSYNDVLDNLGLLLNKQIQVVDIDVDFYANEYSSHRGEIYGRSYDSVNSTEKIKSVVPEFKQTISLKEGLTRTIFAYKAENYQKGIHWVYEAETDRIIKKWCRKKDIPVNKMNLHFIDYLGNASFSDRVKYFIISNQDSLVIGLLLKFLRSIK